MPTSESVPDRLEVAVLGAIVLALFAALIALLVAAWWWVERRREALWERLDAAWQCVIATPPMRALRERHPRAWAFLGRRLSRKGYLGLHLTVGLLLSAMGAWVFAEIAEGVVETQGRASLDLALSRAIAARATPAGLEVAAALTSLGSPLLLLTIAALVAFALALRRSWLLASGVMLATLGAIALDVELKLLFRRPRPMPHLMALWPDSWSFPSGHALGATVAYGMLAYVLVLHVSARQVRALIIVAAALLAIVIGLTRIYLGVHYLTDVLAGYALGTTWLTVCVTGLEVARRRRAGPGAPLTSEALPQGPSGTTPSQT